MRKPVLPSESVPRLHVQLRHKIGGIEVNVEFALSQPWTVLFGPSGSGKTTILRAIAGLLRPDIARIVGTARYGTDNERSISKVDTASGISVPAHKRKISLAAQKPNLFPHMNVRENIQYGMFFLATEDEAELTVAQKTDSVLDLFRISHLADKLPRALSGGEAQRVSIARAATGAMGFLLLDEPFTGLDTRLRSEIMVDVQAWAAKRKLCVLSVTHDVAEAFQLNAEVIKIADGKVVQQGPVEVVLAEERARLLQQLNT